MVLAARLLDNSPFPLAILRYSHPMAVTLKQHADLKARRHELLRELEAIHSELANINRQLAERIRDKLAPQPGSVKHAALSAVKSGHERLKDIIPVVAKELGRGISKQATANALVELRTVGLVLHADRRWMPVDHP